MERIILIASCSGVTNSDQSKKAFSAA